MNQLWRSNVHNNENSKVSIKQMATKVEVSTRPRATLGDIKNVVDAKNPFQKRDTVIKKAVKVAPIKTTSEVQPPKKEVPEEPQGSAMLCDSFSITEAAINLNALLSKRETLRQGLLEDFPDGDEFHKIDALDVEDVHMMSEYVVKINDYLQEREATVQPLKPEFIETSGGKITPRMRHILVDWLVLVHKRFDLLPETLHIAIAIMDRFIQSHGQRLVKDRVQLLGVTALFVASKFEEMYPPEIKEWVDVCDNTYPAEQIRAFEVELLESIDFYMSVPLPLNFLRRYSRLAEADALEHNMAKYLLELTLMEYDLCPLPGNERAAAALSLSLALLRHKSDDLDKAWSPILQFHSGLKSSDFSDTLARIAAATVRQDTPSKYRAIYGKYKSESFKAVSASEELISSLIIKLSGDY